MGALDVKRSVHRSTLFNVASTKKPSTTRRKPSSGAVDSTERAAVASRGRRAERTSDRRAVERPESGSQVKRARGSESASTHPSAGEPPDATTQLGEELRAARARRDWSLRDVAARSAFNSGYLSLLERGQVKEPKPNVLRRLADAYEEPFELLMTWAGYVEDDPQGLSPNQRRALSLLGPEPTEEELEALQTILGMLRKNRSATFSHVYDAVLSVQERDDIVRAVRAALKEADAIGRFPTRLDDIYEVAQLVQADELTLSLEDRRALSARFGEVAKHVWRRLQGVIDFRSDEVWVNPELHPMKQRFVQAHEAGHKLLSWQRDTFAFLDDGHRLHPDVRDLFERQANEAAIELLTQGGRLREEADDDTPPSLRTVRLLSGKYGISLQGTARYIAERSRRECACAIAFKRPDNTLMPYHLFCSRSFQQRLQWLSGRAPHLQIDAVFCAKSMLDERSDLECVDASGKNVTLSVGVLDTPRAVIAFFGHRPRRLVARLR
jgi:transcriptional regulator with XRE-family HTH domain